MKLLLWSCCTLLLVSSCADKKASPSATAPEDPVKARSLPSIFARPAFAQVKAQGKDATLSDVAERAIHSVVNVFSSRVIHRNPGRSPFHGHPFFDRFTPGSRMPQEQRARSLGSGVIINAEGVVLTNNHVVKDAQEIRVKLHDGREFSAKLVGSDPKSDLAVLRLQGDLKQLKPLPIGQSNALRLGEVVLAIGNPFGVGQTVTMGIVSAIGRADVGIVDYEDFIQTDAAINPGNSGGALINMRAELVGINTAILSRSGGYQGIGFAIPTAMAKPIMDSLLTHGRVIRGWLGVMIQELNEEIAKLLKVPVSRGVLITDVVPDSPAAKAGLQRADVITELNGKPLTSVAHLRTKIASAGIEAKMGLTILRESEILKIEVKLGALPGESVAKLDQTQGALGGLTLEPLTDQERRRQGLPKRISGVVIKEIEAGSAAAEAGLRLHDVILEINRHPVQNPFQFSAQYKQTKDKVLLLVYRGGSTLYLLLEK